MSELKEKIKAASFLQVKQVFEGLELIGIETRNKFRIHSEKEQNVAFAAEESTGIGGTLIRLVFKHWRSFRVLIFDKQRQPVYTLQFPFRWFFKTMYVSEANGRRIGHLQQRFAFFRKKFDVFDANGRLVANINSSFFRFWTFEFEDHGRVIGKIQKKWSGGISEIFTDKDNFVVSFRDQNLTEDMKVLMLATTLLVDVVYFENNQGGPDLLDMIGD